MTRRAIGILLAGLTTSLALAAATGKPQPVGGENEGAEELNLLRNRAQWWLERHRGPDGFVPWNARARALMQLNANVRSGLLSIKGAAAATASSSAIEGDVWLPIGPRPINDGSYAYAGRVTALATVPGSPNTVYVGSAQGGVWKTVDGGNSWLPLTDGQDTLAIGALAVDPTNVNVVYAGTGEANQSCDSHYGIGLLKSADGGSTWATLGASTFQNTSIGKVVVHPTTPTTLWVANGSGAGGFSCYGRTGVFGVYKSIDGGASWTLVLGQAQTGVNQSVHDLLRSPSDPNTLYAAVRASGIWKTTDGGSSWIKLGGGLPTTDVGRFDVAINPTNGSSLYALVERASTARQLGTYRSSDAGATWTPLSTPASTCHYWSFSDLCTYSGNTTGQCWYDLVIEVQPGGTVWQGGSAIVKSTTNGASWTDICPQSVHVDQHAIAFGSDGRVWIGNDGGVWASANGGSTWLNKNGNLQITQFYPGAALDANDYERAMAGAQDNGTPRYDGFPAWGLTTFGDGAACVIDASDPLTFYTSSQYLNINKTTDGGFSYVGATNGLFDANTTIAPFIGQFIACPAHPETLIAGSDNVWITTNRADNWSSNGPDPLDASGSPIVTLAFAATDATCGTYAAGTRSGRVFVTSDGGTNWVDVTGSLPLRALNDLAFDPTDPNVLYAAVSGFGGPHLYRTADALSPFPTWLTADAGIPDAPINAVLVDPDEPKVVYAGSDLGLFKSVDAGVSWAFQLNGIPRVAIYDLVADADTRALVAFTHGRGAFRLNLVCTPPQFSGVESVADPSACAAGTTVSWSAPTRWGQLASGGTYELQRFDGAGCAGAATTVATGILAGTLSSTDAATVPGNTYSYRVVATNDCTSPISDPGVNACSAPVIDAADPVPCAGVGPTLVLSHDPADASLSWGAVVCSDIAGYRVYGASSFDAPFPSGWTLLGAPGGTAFTDPLSSAFVAYRVVTVDACGNPSE